MSRSPLIVSDRFLTVPLDDRAQSVMRGWILDHGDDLDQRLRAVGLTKEDVVLPVFERVVYEDEVTDRQDGSAEQ